MDFKIGDIKINYYNYKNIEETIRNGSTTTQDFDYGTSVPQGSLNYKLQLYPLSNPHTSDSHYTQNGVA